MSISTMTVLSFLGLIARLKIFDEAAEISLYVFHYASKMIIMYSSIRRFAP
jgi:hypothetical protein